MTAGAKGSRRPHLAGLSWSLACLLALQFAFAGPGFTGSKECDQALRLGREARTRHNPSDRAALGEARRLYLEALDLCPDLCRTSREVCANLGYVNYLLGDFDKAIDYYQRALDRFPNYGTAHFGLGQVYQRLGLLGLAFDSFLRAYWSDRRDVEARTLAAKIFAEICRRKRQGGPLPSTSAGTAADSRRSLENTLLLEKRFSQTNRRLFYCREKSVPVQMELREITFETGKAVLETTSFGQIAKVGEILRSNPDLKIILEGHTDSAPFGSREAEVAPGVVCADNLCLSRARAESVKQALVERYGLRPDRIKVVAYGDTRPLDPRNTKEARARNRRVTLVLDRESD